MQLGLAPSWRGRARTRRAARLRRLRAGRPLRPRHLLGPWLVPRPAPARTVLPDRASAQPPARGTQPRRRTRLAPALGRPTAPAQRRPPRRGREWLGRGATRGGPDRAPDLSPRPGPGAPPAVLVLTPSDRPPSAPAGGGSVPGRRTRPGRRRQPGSLLFARSPGCPRLATPVAVLPAARRRRAPAGGEHPRAGR